MNSMFRKRSVLVLFSLLVVAFLGALVLHAVVPNLKLQLFGNSSQGERAPDSPNYIDPTLPSPKFRERNTHT
jgi:cytochrome c-type biogenesis protein CcmE